MADAKPPEFDWRKFTPDDSPKTPMDVMADPRHRDLATASVAVGDLAFSFELPLCDFSDGIERATGKSFHLRAVSDQRPVALIFGSYT